MKIPTDLTAEEFNMKSNKVFKTLMTIAVFLVDGKLLSKLINK